MIKIYAYYLPQFHRTPENDKWWGEGFTEWTTVRKAKPLFEGHNQPHEPIEYYDLLEKETMQHQADLMHAYGIDGLCFYHYYFENGKKILEKPAENLLKWKEIDMPFCFYWANQSWVRTWSNLQGANVWTSNLDFDDTKTPNETGILLEQVYGEEKDWREHIEYLLPFFEDDRYIKIDGRPVFIIYIPEDIKCFSDMKKCWDEFMDKRGLPHVYFLGKNTYGECMDGYMEHEPQLVLTEMAGQKFNNEYGIKQILDYDTVWKNVIANVEIGDNYFYGGFVGYDDTPRHGKRGTVIAGQTPQKFKKYLVRLLIKAGNSKNKIVFLNAWNEWGEGMYLEPDLQNENAYLKAVYDAKKIVENNQDVLEDIILENDRNMEKEKINGLQQRSDRYKQYWTILRDWLNLNIEGKKISKYIIDNRIQTVAIYGMGMLGSLLYKELCNEDIKVKYGIDQDVLKKKQFDIPIVTLDDVYEKVDLVIIAVGYAESDIKNKIFDKIQTCIISIEDIIEYAQKTFS